MDDGWGKEIVLASSSCQVLLALAHSGPSMLVSFHEVSRISTDIKNDGTCYTDSNGREMLQRKRALAGCSIQHCIVGFNARPN